MLSTSQNIFCITHLYPKELSIYGDMGNIIAIQKMLTKIGWNYKYQAVEIGQELPKKTDFYFVGGGQDKDQLKITEDILTKKSRLSADIKDGVGLLAICGGYQLFGKEYIDGNGEIMEGLDIFPVITRALDSSVKSRCIGNLVVDCQWLNTKLVGFENHGGQTYLSNPNTRTLGNVLSGYGNNFVDKVEGVVVKNAVGTYLHGSCLPKNPELTKWFINNVAIRKEQKREIGSGFSLFVQSSVTDESISLATKNYLIKKILG